MDYQSWRCKHDMSLFCPEEGCSKKFGCLRDLGWSSGQALQREWLGYTPDTRSQKMQDIPLKVWVMVPEPQRERHGIDATSPPFGVITSIRSNNQSIAMIDEACKMIGGGMSRAAFIRLSAERVAKAIVDYRDDYMKKVEEMRQTDD